MQSALFHAFRLQDVGGILHDCVMLVMLLGMLELVADAGKARIIATSQCMQTGSFDNDTRWCSSSSSSSGSIISSIPKA